MPSCPNQIHEILSAPLRGAHPLSGCQLWVAIRVLSFFIRSGFPIWPDLNEQEIDGASGMTPAVPTVGSKYESDKDKTIRCAALPV